MRMRVLIDTTYAARAPLSGTGIYIRQVCAELRQIGGVELIEVANRRRRPPAGGGLGSVRNLGADLWWTGLELPRLARRHGADLIHHPLPARAPVSKLAQVVTIVDLAFERLPAHFDRGYRLYAHQTHRAAALAASAVITISETTAADARAIWGVPAGRIVVAPLGPGQDLEECRPADTPPTVARFSEPRHFLYVGDDEPRKNLPLLLDAYRRYRESASAPLELILAGSASARWPGVRVEPRPDARRLLELHQGAAALVHPSLYEGFGLTALEAMSVGTPVLAARSPGVLEVCGDAALYADPQDSATLAGRMAEIAGDPALAAELSRRGIARAADFSWAFCAHRHVEAYSLALGR